MTAESRNTICILYSTLRITDRLEFPVGLCTLVKRSPITILTGDLTWQIYRNGQAGICCMYYGKRSPMTMIMKDLTWQIQEQTGWHLLHVLW